MDPLSRRVRLLLSCLALHPLARGPLPAQEAPPDSAETVAVSPDRLAAEDRARLEPLLAVLREEGRDPVQFVHAQLQAHDLVIFDDALHTAVEPFEFYERLVRSAEFRRGGKLVFLEVVSVNQQPHLEAYLSATEHDPALLYPAFQDGVGGLGFPYASYFDLLAAVREANEGLAPEDRILVVAVGSPTWWPEIRTPRDLELFRSSLGSYDHMMYQRVVEEMDGFAAGRKGILLTNTRHAYKGIRDRDGALFWNAGTFLREWHPGRTVHIRCNSASLLVHAQREIGEGEARTTEGLERMEYGWGRVADGLWDTAVAQHGVWPIAVPIVGNEFGKAPYIGNHMLHALPGQKMEDAYDAVLFLAPL